MLQKGFVNSSLTIWWPLEPFWGNFFSGGAPRGPQNIDGTKKKSKNLHELYTFFLHTFRHQMSKKRVGGKTPIHLWNFKKKIRSPALRGRILWPPENLESRTKWARASATEIRVSRDFGGKIGKAWKSWKRMKRDPFFFKWPQMDQTLIPHSLLIRIGSKSIISKVTKWADDCAPPELNSFFQRPN